MGANLIFAYQLTHPNHRILVDGGKDVTPSSSIRPQLAATLTAIGPTSILLRGKQLEPSYSSANDAEHIKISTLARAAFQSLLPD